MYYTSLPQTKQISPFPLSHFSSNPTNKVVDRPKNKQLKHYGHPVWALNAKQNRLFMFLFRRGPDLYLVE